jgi:hypothetical protein
VEISTVAVWIPPFWVKRPAVWFVQVEVPFTLADISNEKNKFYRKISQLDHRYQSEVEDIITSPPQQEPLHHAEDRASKPTVPLEREQCIRQLLTLEEMDDRKPLRFLRHLNSIAPYVSVDFLHSI